MKRILLILISLFSLALSAKANVPPRSEWQNLLYIDSQPTVRHSKGRDINSGILHYGEISFYLRIRPEYKDLKLRIYYKIECLNRDIQLSDRTQLENFIPDYSNHKYIKLDYLNLEKPIVTISDFRFVVTNVISEKSSLPQTNSSSTEPAATDTTPDTSDNAKTFIVTVSPMTVPEESANKTVEPATAPLETPTTKPLKQGCINVQEIIMVMPEAAKMQNDMVTFRKNLESNLESMQVEFNTKLSDYKSSLNNLSDSMRALKEKELQDLQTRINQFEQTATQEIQAKQQTLLEPIIAKARKAINKIGDEGGYDVVYDLSSGFTTYYDETIVVDITPAVKRELGI